MKKILSLAAVGVFYLVLFLAVYGWTHRPIPQVLSGPPPQHSVAAMMLYLLVGLPILGVVTTGPLFWLILKVKPWRLEIQKSLPVLVWVFPLVLFIAAFLSIPFFSWRGSFLTLGIFGLGSVYWGICFVAGYGLYLRHKKQLAIFRGFAIKAVIVLFAAFVSSLSLIFGGNY